MNIVEQIFQENADHHGVAIEEGNQKITYPDLFKRIKHTSCQLESFGITKGARVLVHLKGGCDYVTASLAVLLCEAVMVPLADTATDDEFQETLLISESVFILTVKEIPGLKNLSWLNENFHSPVAVYRTNITTVADKHFDSLDAAFIRFSSGTTGTSKGVVLSHQAILDRTDAADQALKMTRHDRVIWVLNMSFHFVVTIILFLRRGASIVVCEDDFPASFLRSISSGQPTFLYASPFHYALLAKSTGISKEIFKNVRLAISTAMSLTQETAESFYQISGIYPSGAYGIIEVGLPCVNLSQDPSKALSIGKLLPGYALKLMDPDAEGHGKILIKGKGFFNAYLKPFQFSENVTIDGWFDTGDIGRMDHDGYLFITGRTKNVINFCGMKVFPQEVEAVLNNFPNVLESRVYGKPHEQYGQSIVAEIVQGENEIVLDELRLFCYRHLAKYKTPKEYIFVSSLPKTASGKILRH